ncbi:hypothetical protein [Epilithonimonas mollis]|uniref:Uncharacterized protein n=1 Tax=Epilithonimonas mollis TaxID=216903 RepID=A0A1M6RJI0_9FLAO|nr:hypothetical protein [Epilithonimonas mollis]SHK32566.1 hypothetical protein SAMN05444371_1939 [Epilithonimonas mollis]
MKRNNKKFWLAIPCIIAAVGLFIWFFQWLWNSILPDVLGVKLISYWQSLGILVISKILFVGLANAKEKFKNRNNFRGPDHMKENWKKKFETQFCASEEEREKFKEMWKQRFESKFCRQDMDDENSK